MIFDEVVDGDRSVTAANAPLEKISNFHFARVIRKFRTTDQQELHDQAENQLFLCSSICTGGL